MALPKPAPKYRILDPHVHVWLNDPRYPWARETTEPPKDNETPSMLLDLMKANGVARTVLVQFIGYRWDNRYTLDSMRKHKPYFMAVCRVNPADPAAPDQLSKLTEQGFHGVRLSPAADPSGDWIRGRLMPPLWRRAESLKVPMQIYAPITRMPDLVPLMDQCPALDVVIDHMADCPIDQPEQLQKLIALARFPQVFVKISHTWSISRQPYPWLDAQEYVKRLYAVYGPQRLMWGTDWPVCKKWTTYGKALTVVRDDMKFLNARDKSWILSKTVERVWPFP
ncbi:MAG TPA: amidohydrolase family protein [Terriglobia bacterium]|nr:amidohydrolase family protein [Terriglobia bacterium]